MSTTRRTQKFRAALHIAAHEFQIGAITGLHMDADDLYQRIEQRGWQWNSLTTVWTQQALYISRSQPYAIVSVSNEHLLDLQPFEAALKAAYPTAWIIPCVSATGRGYWVGL